MGTEGAQHRAPWRWKRWLAGGILTAAVVAVLFIWLGRRTSPESQLAEARQSLDNLLKSSSPAEQQEHARNALTLLESLKTQNSPEGHRAALLWCAIKSGLDPNADLAATFANIELTHSPTDELLISSELLFGSRQFGLADQVVSEALTRSDDREKVLRLAAIIRFDLGRDDEVLEHCRELTKLVPNDPHPWYVMAMVQRNRGYWEHFVDAAEKTVRLSRDNANNFRLELVEGYIHLGQVQDARKEWDRVAAENPELIPQVPLLHARLLLLEGKQSEVEPILTEYLKQSPDDPEALLIRGKWFFAQAEFQQAVEHLERVIELAPADQDAHYQLGQAFARIGEKERAQHHLQMHRKILDSKVHLHHLEQVAAREPGNVEVRKELASEYAKLGLEDLAEFWARAAKSVVAQ